MTEIEKLKEGSSKFIDELYQECFSSISNWINRNSGTTSEAEDIFQDALVAVYQKATDPDFKLHCKLSTFVFGVAKKMWLWRLRTNGRYLSTDFSIPEAFSPIEEDTIEQIMEEKEIDDLYKSQFVKLKEECQKILRFFFNGYSMQEVMQRMGFQTENMTRKKKFRCKEELVKLIEKDPRYRELTKNEIRRRNTKVPG